MHLEKQKYNAMLALKSLGAFSIKGKDAKKFLQGQLTCDLNQLTPEHPLKGAHCNKEGRVMALYHLIERQDEIILITQKELLSDAMKYLQHYGMFTKLIWQNLEQAYIYADATGNLSISSEKLAQTSQDESIYYHQQILQKQAFLTKATVGKFLPQELELSGAALSFTKGCYIGQEVIARLHYLGKLKKSLHLIESDQALKPLDELWQQDQVVGEVVASTLYQGRCYALALINANCSTKELSTKIPTANTIKVLIQ